MADEMQAGVIQRDMAPSIREHLNLTDPGVPGAPSKPVARSQAGDLANKVR